MPAQIIPPLNSLDEIDVKPERDVCRALLTGLDSTCEVFHSYPWLRPARGDWANKRLIEGEVDFVILHPGWGIMVLEVKGGPIIYNPQNRAWGRTLPSGGVRRIKDPFEQARKSMHELADQIVASSFPGAYLLPGAFGYAVVLPDCEIAGALPPGVDRSILFTCKDLPSLGDKVIQLFRQWSGRDKPSLSDSEAMQLRAGLLPAMKPLSVLWRRHAQQEEQLLRLTGQQQVAMLGLNRSPRVVVEGPAGSGKTMLAIARARRFAEQGERVLYVCYNKALAESLAERAGGTEGVAKKVTADSAGQLTIRHFHGLANDLCSQAGMDFHPPADRGGEATEKFWCEEAPLRMMEALEKVPIRYSAIVVDEGQDFRANWWPALELLDEKREQGRLYVFYDRHQNLFSEEVTVPDLPVRYELPANCRNTRKIAGACGSVRGIDMPVWKSAPPGDAPRILEWSSPEDCRLKAEAIVQDWLRKGGLKPDQIAILGPNSMPKSCFAGVSRIGTTALSHNPAQWRQGKAVLYSSVRGFKGLEADAVIIVDVVGMSRQFGEADLYVGCSRAKHQLVVLCINAVVAEKLRTEKMTVVDDAC